ncbi:MAG: tetratricopeptide repeat protein, partial [Acidobacteriota bacterium]
GGLSGVLRRVDNARIEIEASDILCLMCVRNEALRLPYTLSYYRRLGVSRFLIVDNNSDDETSEFLLKQGDVYLWHTAASFRAARCGTDWTELLLQTYGVDHWCLVVDADELFCYADCETRSLRSLCQTLEQAGARGMSAILLDMYSDQPVRETRYQPGQDFLEVCSYFDREFYHFKTEQFFEHEGQTSYFGGLRQRVFAGKEPSHDAKYFYCLNKVPLIRYDQTFSFSDNLHWTNCRDLADETGSLLHFKYFSSFADHARKEVRRKEHWNGGIQYSFYAEAMERCPDLKLFSEEHSVKFTGSRQLIEMGIMSTVEKVKGASNVDSRTPPEESRGRTTSDATRLVRQVREMIRAQKQKGETPHEEGITRLKQGDLEGAATAFRRAIELNPEFSWSHHNLGDVLMMQKRSDDALGAFKRAIELNPHFALSHNSLGDLLAMQGDWTGAVEAYRKALELRPDLGVAAKGLARTLARLAQTQIDEAKLWFGRAHEINPDDLELCHEALELRPLDSDLCRQFGDAFAERNHLHEAVFCYQLGLDVSPDDARLLLNLAEVLRRSNDIEHATICCKRAIGVDPGNGGAHRLLAELLTAQRRLEEAVAAFERACQLDPASPELNKQRGDLLSRLGRIDEASKAYSRALELGYRAF